MKIFFVVFNSKTQVLFFIEKMRENGFYSQTMPLPKEVHRGCGICAKINGDCVNFALKVVRFYSIDAFYGIYSLEKNGTRKSLARIY